MHQRTHFHGKLNLFCIFNGIYLGKTPHKRKLFRMFPYQFPTLIPKGIDLFSYIRSHTKKNLFCNDSKFCLLSASAFKKKIGATRHFLTYRYMYCTVHLLTW